jgi:hypothetical protein
LLGIPIYSEARSVISEFDGIDNVHLRFSMTERVD